MRIVVTIMSSNESLNSEKTDKLIGITIDNKYKINKILGKGSFGICYEGLDITTGVKVALKVEKDKTSKEHKELVENERKAHQILDGMEGIPKLLNFGVFNNKHIIVMELLGKDLSKLFHELSKKFSLKTILMLAEQMINRTRSIHHKHLIHRDLKPENFLIGLKGDDKKRLFLTDFGLVKRYVDDSGQHITCAERTTFSGTVRYCSVNTHKGQSMSRRDDFESIAYILMYFIRGELPWDGWKTTQSDQFYKDVQNKKESILETQFGKEMPEIIKDFLKYCRRLKYEEEPEYNQWIQSFKNQRIKHNFNWDYNYDWISTQK